MPSGSSTFANAADAGFRKSVAASAFSPRSELSEALRSRAFWQERAGALQEEISRLTDQLTRLTAEADWLDDTLRTAGRLKSPHQFHGLGETFASVGSFQAWFVARDMGGTFDIVASANVRVPD